jgi:hypothetical protein
MNKTQAHYLCTTISRARPDLHPVVAMIGIDYVIKLQSLSYRRWTTDYVIWSTADWDKYLIEGQPVLEGATL